MIPDATKAEYSPRLRPATRSGLIPFSLNKRKIATEVVKIAGWVYFVSFSFSSSLSIKARKSYPKAWLASSKVALTVSYWSYKSRAIPSFCAPWPENKNAVLVIIYSNQPFESMIQNQSIRIPRIFFYKVNY